MSGLGKNNCDFGRASVGAYNLRNVHMHVDMNSHFTTKEYTVDYRGTWRRALWNAQEERALQMVAVTVVVCDINKRKCGLLRKCNMVQSALTVNDEGLGATI